MQIKKFDLKLMTSTYTNQITNAKKEGINKRWSRRSVLDLTKDATSAEQLLNSFHDVLNFFSLRKNHSDLIKVVGS